MLSGIFIALCVSTGVAFAQSAVWEQCGGQDWLGPKTCVTGTVCTVLNPFYSQCIPSAAGPTTTTTVVGTTTSSAPPTSTGVTGLNLRLLPLGDSITFGLQSSDGNGYRGTLHNLLQPNNTVNFIGSIKAGQMADNDNEGHSGFTVNQIASSSTNAAALPARPNVVLLMAGTNDMASNSAAAVGQLGTLIDSIFTRCPDAALIVSTLIPLSFAQTQVNTYNQAVRGLVSTRAAAGKHILLADMSPVLSSDLADGVHPNNAGYVKMANVWFPVVQQAARNGWIGTPV